MTILTNTAPHLPMLLSKMRLLANGMQVRCHLANEYFEYNICFRTSLKVFTVVDEQATFVIFIVLFVV